MNTLRLRLRLVGIAHRDVGQVESSRNHGAAMQRYWPATNYPGGYANREPYCAAAVCYWLREWLADPEVMAALKMTPAQAAAWRCKSPAAFGWTEWARKRGLLVMGDSPDVVLHTGDIMTFDISHIGIVTGDTQNFVDTIEANTGPGGGRDGDGIFVKVRRRTEARNFIRLLA